MLNARCLSFAVFVGSSLRRRDWCRWPSWLHMGIREYRSGREASEPSRAQKGTRLFCAFDYL